MRHIISCYVPHGKTIYRRTRICWLSPHITCNNYTDLQNTHKRMYIYIYNACEYILFACLRQQWHNLNVFFFRRIFWKYNFLSNSEERDLIISVSKQCTERYQFPSTYTVISGLFDDVHNSKVQNFELWHCCSKQANYIYIYIYIYVCVWYIAI